MYPSVRTTLKAKHQDSRRHTLKAGKAGKASKQKGGADWYRIPEPRKADWNTYLDAHADLKAKF
jgi:hypothetical protein